MDVHDLSRVLQKVSNAMLSQQSISVAIGSRQQHQNIVRIDMIGDD